MAILCLAIVVFLWLSPKSTDPESDQRQRMAERLAQQFEDETRKMLEAQRRILREDHYTRLQAWEKMKTLTERAEEQNKE
ncbi:MAG: hypothetical protein ABIG11_10320 [bacterium]